MAEDGERMQTRSMTRKEKGANPNEGDAQPTDQGPEDTQSTTMVSTMPNPMDGLDDIARCLRVSLKKIQKFWYIPDLKNTRLRDITETRLPHPNNPVKILINAPELKRFFKTTTFEICLDTGKVWTYTDPRINIGVGLEPDPFILEELENHFKEQTKITEAVHHMERIPLMERITPTTEVMPLKEFERNIGQYSNLCQMYGKASCKLFHHSSISEYETAKAYDKLQPYISNILDQVDKGLSLFQMEREIRNRKGRGRLRIPYIVPKEKLINTAKQLQ